MPPRNKRKRPIKPEPSDSDSDCAYASDDQQAPQKRVKAEVKEEVKVEELSDGDFAIVLSDCELSDSSDCRTGRPVRRSAGGRPPRRGVDVAELYEEVGAGQLARSLGQVVKEEGPVGAVSDTVKVEEGESGIPFRVSDYVRRAAAVRAEQLLRGDKESCETTAGRRLAAQKQNGRKRVKFTQEQRSVLRAQFDADPYPDRATKEGLSEQLGVEYESIQRWFRGERERGGILRSNYDSARKKCVFGFAVYDRLVAQFELNPRPDLATRKALAVKAGASVTQINSWFENRRKSQVRPQMVEITPAMRAKLEAVFKANPHPAREKRAMLAEKIGCSMTQISNWFNKRRQKAGIKGSKEEYSRRTCQFGPEGYDSLVAEFESNPYPDRETRATIATGFGGTVEQVSNWFQARRVSEGIASRAHQARLQCAVGPAAYDELVAAFEADPFPESKTRAALAAKTGGTVTQITNWFSNKRQKKRILSTFARSKCKFGVQVYDELVAQFEADPFPDSTTVKMLANKAGGSHEQIRNWFFGRRRHFGIQRSKEERARQRSKFGSEVYDQLVAQFKADPYPSIDVITGLAERAGATTTQIRNWFRDRRHSKHRRKKQK